MKKIKVLWEKTPGALNALDMCQVTGMDSRDQYTRESALDMAVSRLLHTDRLFVSQNMWQKGETYRIYTQTGRIVGEVEMLWLVKLSHG